MYQRKLLLCTDLDRTVIPNGVQAEHPDARRRFREFCERPEVTLVFVTGRHRELVKQAIKNYSLPKPDYAITDVGTKIYRIDQGESWLEMDDWKELISKDWQGKSREDIKELLDGIRELHLQEYSRQNTHKLSYYLPLYADEKKVIAEIQRYLKEAGVSANLIWSIDEPKGVGLLDVLPRHADKLYAIEYLQRQLEYALDEVVFAGDSGNDLSILSSQIHSVLVANASDEIKEIAQQMATQNGHADALYLAGSGVLNMDGNYSAGVLQGVWHFVPAFRDALQ